MAISRTLKSKKVKTGDTSSKAKSDILKPFQCQDCDATFGRKADCQRHWNTKHDPDRKSRELVCPWVGCDKTFSQKSNFEDHYKTHMPRHLTQRPCPFSKACPFLWVTRSALSKHKKESHGKNAVKVVRSTDAQSLHASETPEFISPAPSPTPSTSTSSDRPLSQSVSM
ncbi:uncharacterized protein STEHIDRAFT_123142, partial [Stereum hirsutum FP-91666 SS1]|uniref:uncharacterized protein n=1 Tax=Stereum hirsutum (strain FP-91666) TaxID=721885 RepID=UPI00044498D4